MDENKFNTLAGVYGWFFTYQTRYYRKVLEKAKPLCDLSRYESVIDVGCGTGALCSVLHSQGLKVTGVDSAARMLAVAAKKLSSTGVQLVQADAHQILPFSDKSFDIAISSYTAHGMPKAERIKLYREMSRLARHRVILHDYNDKRAFIVDIAERLEGSDYYNFIHCAEEEMSTVFRDVVVQNMAPTAAWYICTPN
jgi:ubiquinone/menaquinone biosynthesis C-methylase UbiE